MKTPSRLALWALLVLVAFPAGLLAVRTILLMRPLRPVLSTLRDGSQILSVPLEQDEIESSRGVRRHLLADGSVKILSDDRIVHREFSRDAYVVRSEDGPLRLGFLEGVVANNDTLRGQKLADRLESLRVSQREDRDRLVLEVRQAGGTVQYLHAMERWSMFSKSDQRVGLLLRDGQGNLSFLRLSSVRFVDQAPFGVVATSLAWVGRICSILFETPDSWGIGGLRQALVSTITLILLSGMIGGTLALLAAFLLNERLRPGRWARVVRRSSEWLAAVPGVVWGAAGLGLLVSQAGTYFDLRLERGLHWATGGLLWASMTLGILAIPLSLKRALDALESVPRQWRRIARSCGATRWQVLHLVVLPNAWPSLLGAWLSAFARAAGETAPLILVGATHAIGGDVLESGWHLPSLSGGFSHLGVLACDPPWPVIESELGHPVAFLSLFVLTLLCIGFELVAGAFLGKGVRSLERRMSE